MIPNAAFMECCLSHARQFANWLQRQTVMADLEVINSIAFLTLMRLVDLITATSSPLFPDTIRV